MPKIKKYVCQCVYCMYPFGPGAPVCVRERLVNKATLRFTNAQKKVVSITKPCYRIRIKKKNEQDDT